jgi:hypothetical protein
MMLIGKIDETELRKLMGQVTAGMRAGDAFYAFN